MQATLHPRYTGGRGQVVQYDVAVLTLASRVSYTDYVSPLCLAPSVGVTRVPRPLTVLGWGDSTPGWSHTPSNTLLQLEMREVSTATCRLQIGDGTDLSLLANKKEDSVTNEIK